MMLKNFVPSSRVPSGITDNSPAANAGLRAGDVVLEIDGVAVQNSDHLVRLVQFTPVGSQSAITFVRDGVKRKATVTVGDRESYLSSRETEE